jgi:hypothetical protein
LIIIAVEQCDHLEKFNTLNQHFSNLFNLLIL